MSVPHPVRAESPYDEFGLAAEGAESAAQAKFPLEIQAGLLSRLGGTEARPDKAGFLLVGNIDFLDTQQPGWAYGGGARFMSDDDGTRYGLRGVVRYRFAGYGLYAQVAPWLALAGQDNRRTLRLPGYGTELEFGQEDWVAVTLGLEIVEYRDYWLSTTYDGFDATINVRDEGTEVSWYLGGKLNGPVKSLLGLLSVVLIAFSVEASL